MNRIQTVGPSCGVAFCLTSDCGCFLLLELGSWRHIQLTDSEPHCSATHRALKNMSTGGLNLIEMNMNCIKKNYDLKC